MLFCNKSSGTLPNAKDMPCYHSVKGQDMWGLIFDPGAAGALSGTHTVWEYLNYVLRPNHLDQEVVGLCQGTFTGISGKPEPGGLRIRLPINLGPFTTNFETDTIGGSADKCPMLLPNEVAIRRKMISMHGYFDNGDGLLLIPDPDKSGAYGIRMILTDSGHYLVPIKDPNYQATKQDEQLQQQATKQFFEMHSYVDQMYCQDKYIHN